VVAPKNLEGTSEILIINYHKLGQTRGRQRCFGDREARRPVIRLEPDKGRQGWRAMDACSRDKRETEDSGLGHRLRLTQPEGERIGKAVPTVDVCVSHSYPPTTSHGDRGLLCVRGSPRTGDPVHKADGAPVLTGLQGISHRAHDRFN
jgi:hypothetical protein